MVRQPLEHIEKTVLALSAAQFGITPAKISLGTRPVQDLGIDSLDLIEWMLALEDAFEVSLPDAAEVGDPTYKEVFTRAGLTLRDMAELVYLPAEMQRFLEGEKQTHKTGERNGEPVSSKRFISQARDNIW